MLKGTKRGRGSLVSSVHREGHGRAELLCAPSDAFSTLKADGITCAKKMFQLFIVFALFASSEVAGQCMDDFGKWLACKMSHIDRCCSSYPICKHHDVLSVSGMLLLSDGTANSSVHFDFPHQAELIVFFSLINSYFQIWLVI